MNIRYFNRLVSLIMAALLFGGLCFSETAYAEEEEVIRVGFYEMQGFQYYDEYGNISGYNIEYLNMISRINDWTYEFVDVGDFNNGLELLKNKEIDLIAPAMLTESRVQEFSYGAYDFGTEYTVLITKESNNTFFYEDYESFNGMTVAVVEDYPLTDYFLLYMEQNDFEAELKYYSNPDAAVKALNNDEVDAAVTALMTVGENHKLLARFSPMPFYYLTWKDNLALINELDSAMQKIQNSYPGYEEELLNRYYPAYGEQYFSKEELDFLAELGTLRVAYVADWKPLSFENEKTGELDGISRPIFDNIAEILGLEFEYVALPQGGITYKYLQEQKIDLITGVSYNSENINAKGMFLSQPYLDSRKVMVGYKDLSYDEGMNYKVAVVMGSQTLQQVVQSRYPNCEVVEYATIKECFDALYRGEAGYLLQNQYVAENWLSKPKYEGMYVVPAEGLEDKLCFSAIVAINDGYGMSEQDSVMLIRIIDKAISKLEDSTINSIIISETKENSYNYNISDYIYKYRYSLIVITISAVLIAGYTAYVVLQRRKNKKLRQEKEKIIMLQQKRYQMIIDNSGDMLYEIGLKENSGIATEKIRDYFGWSVPEKVETFNLEQWIDIFHVYQEDKERALAFVKAVINDGKSDDIKLRLVKSNGNPVWCEATCLPLLDDHGELVSLIGKITDVDDDVKEKEALELKTRRDGLTGLLNKQTFENEVRVYLAQHSAKDCGIIFIDMDHFKSINDTFGHITGDMAIKNTAQKLQIIFANFDLVARFGGDEFYVFVKDIPRSTLYDKLVWALDKLKERYSNNETMINVTASIGVAYCVRETAHYNELLDLADAAVYEAKANGRNGFVIKDLL